MINEKYGFEFLAVGDKYEKAMPGDGAIFEMYGQTCSINIGISNPTEEEVALLSSGRLDIYLSVIEGIVFVTAKFSGRECCAMDCINKFSADSQMSLFVKNLFAVF